MACCKDLLARHWDVEVQHVYKEGNRAGDILAREAGNWGRGLHIFHVPPEFVRKTLEEDLRGTSALRRIVASST